MSEKNNEPPIDNGGDEEKKEEPNDRDNGGDEEAAGKVKDPFNVNTYATHKSLTAGAMDIALLTSNANQIKMIASADPLTSFQTVTLAMLGISIIMQCIVVFLIVMMGTSKTDLASTDAEQEKAQRKIDKMNKLSLGLVTFITLINVLASALAGDLNLKTDPTGRN
jgi:hypothetical protein